MRICLGIVLAILIGMAGCSEDNPANSGTNTPIGGNGSIEWVGTDVAYNTDSARRPFSLIYFSTTWCTWCRKMEADVWSDSTIRAIVGESFNAITVDPEVDSNVVYRGSEVSCRDFAVDIYGVRGFPTVCFLDSTGNYLSSKVGYASARDFEQILRSVRGF